MRDERPTPRAPGAPGPGAGRPSAAERDAALDRLREGARAQPAGVRPTGPPAMVADALPEAAARGPSVWASSGGVAPRRLGRGRRAGRPPRAAWSRESGRPAARQARTTCAP